MKLIAKADATFDHILDYLTWLACALFLSAPLLVTCDVVTRYLLGHSLMLWVIEICEYILLYTAFLGAAWLLRREGHVKMDLVLNMLKPRSQALLNTITSVLGVAICLTLTWLAAQTTWENFVKGYYRDTILDPPSFLFHGVVALGGFLLFIQFIRRTHGYLRSWRTSSGQEQRS